MTTPTDIQGYRPVAGLARPDLGAMATTTWHNHVAHDLAPAAFNMAPKSFAASVKRHDGISTGRPSEAPT